MLTFDTLSSSDLSASDLFRSGILVHHLPSADTSGLESAAASTNNDDKRVDYLFSHDSQSKAMDKSRFGESTAQVGDVLLDSQGNDEEVA